jgi:thiol-disulfide isomerase/thioredoxin
MFKNRFLLYFALFSGMALCAQTKSAVVKNMLAAIDRYRDYYIEYEKQFKFQSENDTIRERISSEIHYTLGSSFIGWEIAENVKYGNQNRFVVSNYNEITSLYGNDSARKYYRYMYSLKDAVNYVDRQRKIVYQPFLRNKKDLRNFVIVSRDINTIVLEENDSSTEKSLGIYIVSRTILTLDAVSYLPVSEEHWAWFEGGVQYSKYMMRDIAFLPETSTQSLQHRSDSMQRAIRRFINGDSFWAANRKPLKIVKEGDTAFNFSARFHGSRDSFSLSRYRDSIVILDFFYTSCGPCVAAVPDLKIINEKFRNRGVRVFAVDPISGDWPKLDKCIGFYKINYSVLEAEHNISEEYGVEGYPTVIVIKNGIIMKIHLGFSKDLDVVLEKELEALLKG